jgi:hypothetical protein
MVAKRFIIILLLTFIFGVATAQEVTLTADKTEFSIQEQVRLTFTFTDLKNIPRELDIKLDEYFNVIAGPHTSSSYSIVNGKSTSTIKISYDLIPKKIGRVMIPSYEIVVGNKTYKTDPFALNVHSTSVQPGEEMPNTFMELVLPKDAVYQGETFTIHYYLYTAERVVNYTSNPVTSMEGFIIDRFNLSDNPVSSKKLINGKEYLIANIASLTLTATAAGEYIIPAKMFRISLRRSGQSRSFWDDPFFGGGTKDININAPGDTITVFPLPPGGGTHFTGAIGEFSLMTSLDSTRIRENQAITLKISMVGRGNMQHFTFPDQSFSKEFEVFEPKVRNNYRLTSQDYQGERTWEYILIPSKPGNYSFDDVQFTYFSLKDRRYKTLRAPLETVQVISRNELEGDYAALSPHQVRFLSRDIRFLQMNEGHCKEPDHNPLADTRNWIPFFIAAFLAVIFLIADMYLAMRNKNMIAIRYRNALKNAVLHFRQITHDLPPEEILKKVEDGIYTYLQDKKLRPEEIPAVKDLMKTIETYKYAPGMLSDLQLDTLKDKALSIIEDIEEK